MAYVVITETDLNPFPNEVLGTIKLPDDEEGHPSGQWSARLEKTETVGIYRLRTLVAGRLSAVCGGDVIPLYRGPKKIATLVAV